MKRRLSIGIFNDSFYPMSDGVIVVIDNYARRLSAYADVVVFVPNYSEKFDDSKLPYKVVRCHSLSLPFLDYNLPIPDLDISFKREIDKYNFDIVHVHSPFTLGKAGIHYAKKHNIPCVATMHSQFKQDFYKATHSELISKGLTDELIHSFEKCNECWAVNKEVARIYHEEYGYSVMPKVMNNATDMLPVKSKSYACGYINKKWNLNKNTKVFLFVGRINTLKNILFIVDALEQLKLLRPSLDFKMLFVGSGQDENVLLNHVQEKNLQDNIILCGKETDRKILAYYYARAELFLFPSIYDASSLVQIEAASQGTPTVFLEDTATAATVTNNENGFLSVNDPLSYANKIIEILENQKLYMKVSQNAQIQLYKNWDNVVKKVYKEYQRIIKTSK